MKKKIIVLGLLIITILTGCSFMRFDSFSDVYENGNTTQQIEYALQNNMFEKIGFTERIANGESSGWETNNTEKNIAVSYYFGFGGKPTGMIKKIATDYSLTIYITDSEYTVRLQGKNYSYICKFSAVDMSLIDPWEYQKDYDMIFEKQKISEDDIIALVNLYSNLTTQYMKELYEYQ